MNADTDFHYAQARLHARYGERPADEAWRRLHTTRTAGQLLAVAQSAGLARWVALLAARQETSEVDGLLRQAFAKHALEVASWVPERWKSSVAWIAQLAELDGREGGIRSKTDVARWAARFRELWPFMDVARRRSIEQVCALVSEHLEQMARADPEMDGWTARGDLERDLARLFRRSSPGPAAVYAYLGLVLLDLERLRGAFVRRLLFPNIEGESAWV